MKNLKDFINESRINEDVDDNLFWLLDKWFERNENQKSEFISILVQCRQEGDKVNIDNLKKLLHNTELKKDLKEFINFLSNDLEPQNNKNYLYELKQVVEVVIGKKEKNKYLDENQITEKLIINKNIKIKEYNYHPKSTTELRKILWDLLEKRGENADLNDIDTSKITFMDSLFSDSDFNGDISQWDVSNVEDMDFMFYNSNFTGENGDISNWDVSKVEHMKDMFLKSPLEKNPPKWYKL